MRDSQQFSKSVSHAFEDTKNGLPPRDVVVALFERLTPNLWDKHECYQAHLLLPGMRMGKLLTIDWLITVHRDRNVRFCNMTDR